MNLFADVRLQTVGYTLVAMLLVVPCLAAAGWLRAALALPRVLVFSIVLIVLGLAAETMFFLTMISAIGAVVCAWIAAVAGLWFTVRAISQARLRAVLIASDCWAPFAVTALAALAYLSFLCSSIPGTGSILFTLRTWLTLPIDNMLPHILALHIAAHAPPKPFVNQWLSSDRPPLQAGFDLLFSALAPPFTHDIEPRYQGLSTLLQAATLGMLYTLCRLCGCAWLRCAAIVLLAWCSGFFFLNTLFVWPKLLAAAYLAVPICLFLAPGKLTRPRAVGIGLGTGFAFLCHGGVVFAVALAWFINKRARAIVPFLTALSVAVLVLAPWTWYQNVYDPPANRLLKWYLAGVTPVTDDSFSHALRAAYSGRSPATIAGYKIGNLVTTLGINSTLLNPTREKDREFYLVRDALGALFIPFLAALWFVRSKRRTLRVAARLAWTAVGGIGFWCLAVYLPGTTIVHVGSYLTMLLMFAAGGIVATEWLPAFLPIALWQIVDFGRNWLTLVPTTYLPTPAGVYSMLLLLAVIATCGRMLVPAIVARLRPWSARDYLTQNRRGIFTLAASCALVGSLVLWMGQRVVFTMPIADVAVAATPAALTIFPVQRLATIARRHASRGAGKLAPALSFDAIAVGGHVSTVAGEQTLRTFAVSEADSIDFAGWAFDPLVQQPAAGVAIEIGGRLFPASYGVPRPDVAKALSAPALIPVGFAATVNGRELADGPNVIRIFVVSSDGRGYDVYNTVVRLEKR